MSTPLPEAVQQALRAGRTVEALRLLRTGGGLDLWQALAAVASGRMPSAVDDPRTAAAVAAAADRARPGSTMPHRVRPLSGVPARPDREPGATRARAARPKGLSPGEVPRNRHGGVLLLVVAVLLLVLWVLSIGTGIDLGTRV